MRGHLCCVRKLALLLSVLALLVVQSTIQVEASARTNSKNAAKTTSPPSRLEEAEQAASSATSDGTTATAAKPPPPPKDSPLRICILCEPSPLTYLSGQAGRFTALMEHLANADDYKVPHTTSTSSAAADSAEEEAADLDKSYIHLVTAEKAHPSPPTTYQPKNNKHNRNNATTTPTVAATPCTIPVHYTQGVVLPNYAGLTVCADWTLKVLRLLWPRKDRKFDLMHVSTPGFLVFPAIIASHLYQIPLVMSYHTHLPIYMRSYFPGWFIANFMEWLGWMLVKFGHAFADLTLLPSPQMADQFLANRIKRCHVWPKGIDTHRFHPRHKCASMRRRMIGHHHHDDNDNNNCFLLVYIGRLAREKRLQDLRELLQQLNNNDNNRGDDGEHQHHRIHYRLCIVGTGPEEESLREYFANTPTTFLGRLDGKQLSEAFASGDVFVMPSDSETLGFVVLESMASGVPCVAAKAGGLMDIIQHNCSGMLVETGNTKQFAAAIQTLQRDPQLYQRLAQMGRNETEQWSWDASMRHVHEKMYQKARQNFSKRPFQRFKRWTSSVVNRS